MKIYAIIPAAGSGSRFKGKNKKNILPKQFLQFRGRPLIVNTLLAIQKGNKFDGIFICSSPGYFDRLHQIVSKYKIKDVSLVEGGNSRFESVHNAFKAIGADRNDFILIHDAVRPFITGKMIKDIIKETKKSNAAIYALKITDTVKKVRDNLVEKTIDRTNLWSVQTPQCFKASILQNSYRKFKNKKTFTDESSLAEEAGYKVKVLAGSGKNIKITTKQDLK